MSLPSSGPIDFAAIRTELSLGGTLDLNDSRVRGLAGKPSGTISFSDLRGKSNSSPFSLNKAFTTDFGSVLYDDTDTITAIPFTVNRVKTISASFTCTDLHRFVFEKSNPTKSGMLGLRIKNSSGVVVASDILSVAYASRNEYIKTYTLTYTSPVPDDLTVEIVYQRITYSKYEYGFKNNGIISLTGITS